MKYLIYVLRLVSLKQLRTFEHGNLIYVTEKGLPAPLGTSRRHFQTLFKLLSVNCEVKLCQFFIWTFQEFSMSWNIRTIIRKSSLIMIVPRRDRSFSQVTCAMKPKSGQSWWRKNHVEVSRLLSVALEPLIHETNELELIIMGTSLTLKFIWRHLQLQPHIIEYGPYNMGNKKLLITISLGHCFMFP